MMSLDDQRTCVVGGTHDMDRTETFLGQERQHLIELHALLANHVERNMPIRAPHRTLFEDRERDVENDRDDRRVARTRHGHERAPGAREEVGGVDDSKPSEAQPRSDDMVKQPERLPVDLACVLVVADKRTTDIGGDDLRGQEVAVREGRLTG